MKVLKPLARRYAEQLQHRLVHQLGIRPVEARMPRGVDPVEHDLVEIVDGHAGMGRRHEREQALLARSPPAPSCRLRSSALNGCLVFHSGCLRRQRLHPIDRERRSGSTSAVRTTACRRCRRWRCARRPARNPARPAVVTRATKSVMDFFAAPSFQEGSGSACASAATDATISIRPTSVACQTRRMAPPPLSRLSASPRACSSRRDDTMGVEQLCEALSRVEHSCLDGVSCNTDDLCDLVDRLLVVIDEVNYFPVSRR